MAKHYILIDFENVQPANVETLCGANVKLLVFVGAKQGKLSFEIADAVQKMGQNAEYIKISGCGANALDFHIAYYVGHLATTEPNAQFHIVSNDTGFEPLIEHLLSKKITVSRIKTITEASFLKSAKSVAPLSRSQIILNRLEQMNLAKPRTEKTLTSTIVAHFKKQISEQDAQLVIEDLCKQGKLRFEDSKIVYALGS